MTDFSHGWDHTIEAAVMAERDRCIKLVLARAAKWNESAHNVITHDNCGDCSESLADECEDIAAAIKRG